MCCINKQQITMSVSQCYPANTVGIFLVDEIFACARCNAAGSTVLPRSSRLFFIYDYQFVSRRIVHELPQRHGSSVLKGRRGRFNQEIGRPIRYRVGPVVAFKTLFQLDRDHHRHGADDLGYPDDNEELPK
ncbi:hypothetical protein ACFS07_22370 [Undibacterium arcticum]